MEQSIASEIGDAEKREALNRVLGSDAFNRSDQLKALLRYIAEREIEGRGSTLDEYTVAVEALGRPRNYSAFEDGTARNRFHNLRRRLEQYYHDEKPDSPIQIVLPKGSYCPVFVRHTVVPSPVVSPPPASEPPVPAVVSRGVSLRACTLSRSPRR